MVHYRARNLRYHIRLCQKKKYVTDIDIILCCLFERKLSIILKDWYWKPQAASLAIKRLCKMQSKAFEKSVKIAPLIPPLSKHFRNFSVITRCQCCVLKPLLNPHCILRVYDWSICTFDRIGTFFIPSTN